MAEGKAKFRVMRNGYDRFAVDATVDAYEQRIIQLEKELKGYQVENEHLSYQLSTVRSRYKGVLHTQQTKERAAEDIARLALREANAVIDSAQHNADMIVREALSTARLVLTPLAELNQYTEEMKLQLLDRAEAIRREVEDFQSPTMPDLRWLIEAEKEAKEKEAQSKKKL